MEGGWREVGREGAELSGVEWSGVERSGAERTSARGREG